MIENWDAVAWNGLARLRQDASNHPDSEELAELIEHARSSVSGTPRPSSVGSSLITCPHFRMNGTIIPTITITAQFTAARTATTDELRIQLVFPETEAGAELFTQLAAALRQPRHQPCRPPQAARSASTSTPMADTATGPAPNGDVSSVAEKTLDERISAYAPGESMTVDVFSVEGLPSTPPTLCCDFDNDEWTQRDSNPRHLPCRAKAPER